MVQELPRLVVTWSDRTEGQSGLVGCYSSCSILKKVASLSQREVGRSLDERNRLGILRGLLRFSHCLVCLPASQQRERQPQPNLAGRHHPIARVLVLDALRNQPESLRSFLMFTQARFGCGR